MADKFFFIKGGAERYYFELKALLEAHGHEVIPFSMQHPNNFPSEYAGYFVENVEFNHSTVLSKLRETPKILGRMVYSRHARARLEDLLAKTKPDLAHLHMIDHQLSPSILHSFRKFGIPVIQTVHQYKIVCPNYKLYNPRTGKICERCLGGKFYHPLTEKCHKNSRLAGALLAVESYVHKWARIYDHIDLFHTPSAFMRQKLIEGGIAPARIRKLYYTINLKDYPYSPEFDDYFVFYGRLSHEKGVMTLLRAMQTITKSRLLIIGDGPQRQELENFTRQHNLRNVEFTGMLSKAQFEPLIRRARFNVVPSEWYDNSPLVIYESFSYGKPVLGARLGGIAELVDHESNGLLFTAGRVDELRHAIERLLAEDEVVRKFGQAARAKAEAEFSPEYHYEKIMEMYRYLLSGAVQPVSQAAAC